MKNKDYGTCSQKISRFNRKDLRFGVDIPIALRISCYSRQKPRRTDAGAKAIEGKDIDSEAKYYSMESPRTWIQTLYKCGNKKVNYYDSQTGRLLFTAPIMRQQRDVIWESQNDGYPSFRWEEVNWDNVRIVEGSDELVSIDGTHLGFRLWDSKGSRY
jgi:hypothetical protein